MATAVRDMSGGPARVANGAEDIGALVRRAQRGDVEAFASLVRSHDHEVRRVAQRIVRDAEDAEDMTQDVWLRVAEKIAQISEPDRFRAWVHSIARSVCLNFLRRRSSALSTGERDGSTEADLAHPADDAYSPEHHVLRHDDQRRLWEALGTLSEQDRVILRLRELEDGAYADIGAILSTSAHAAEVRGSRARDRLRRRLSVIDQARVPCHVNPLQLRSLVNSDGRAAESSLDDHISSCRTCQHRLASMHVGKSVFSGLTGLLLLPRELTSMLANIRAAIGRGEVSLGGTNLVQRLPLSVPAAGAFDSVALLNGTGGLAAAATALSMALTLGTVPADAYSADPATHASEVRVPSASTGSPAIEAAVARIDPTAATSGPAAPPESTAPAVNGEEQPSASVSVIAPKTEAAEPTEADSAQPPSSSAQPPSTLGQPPVAAAITDAAQGTRSMPAKAAAPTDPKADAAPTRDGQGQPREKQNQPERANAADSAPHEKPTPQKESTRPAEAAAPTRDGQGQPRGKQDRP